MIAFDRLCLDDATRAAFEALPGSDELELGRVVSLDRGFPLVDTAADELRAELATDIKKSDDSIVAVGDWVALRIPEAHDKAIIETVLPRRVEIARVKRVGREKQVRRQVLAANVDRVFICQSLSGQGVDMELLVRQMAAVRGAGAEPVFLLTKRDMVDEATREKTRAAIEEVMPDVTLLMLATLEGEGVEEVRALCPRDMTVMLLGESGVGKSALVNALVGEEVLETGETRERDDKGRHTTVARRIIEIPDGGLIVDAPGLRTLQIIDPEEALRRGFPDIAEAAASCRFSDCTHTHEPGCAVRETIPQPRLDAYLALRDRILR